MKYFSVCSGIEAATVAWHPLGWKAAAFAEIEPFPAAVLAHRYPAVPNLGDITQLSENDLEVCKNVDVLVGGTPCQAWSVAGKRRGMEDPRAKVAQAFIDIAEYLRPEWVLWETCLACSPRTVGGTSRASSAGLSLSGMAWPGGCLMLDSSECPSAAVASSLSDILETSDVPARYFLSPRAAAGILRRAEKRKRTVPAPLRAALEAIAER